MPSKTQPVYCGACGYPLTGLALEARCPECGAGPERRGARAAAARRARRLTIACALLTLPSWCCIAVLCSGWVVAHWVIGIPNPHGVQDGVYPALDVLGDAASAAFLASLVSMAAAPILLPMAVIAHFRAASGGEARRAWRATAILLLLSTPIAVELSLFPGPPRGLVGWVPD